MRDVEAFLKSRPLEEPPDTVDNRMARLFASPPADARWWRRPVALWQGVAAAAIIGLACYGAGRYVATLANDDGAVAKETVYYIIQDTAPGTRNAFDAPAAPPGQEWWRQTAQPQPKRGAI